MKRILVLMLISILCLCCLASCGSAYEENTWFSEEKLAECLVDNFPTITKDYVNHNGEDIYVSFTNSEFEAYAKSVYDYLCLQEYEYLGTRGDQKDTLAGVFTTYYFEPANELSSFLIEGDYVFVFSDGAVDENGDVEFIVLVIYDVSKNTLEYGNKKFTYNTMISLSQGSEALLSGFYVLKEEEHEHTGKWYKNETIHFYEYTCGCENRDIAELHLDGDGDELCDICSYQMVAEGNHFIRNQAGAQWLCEITADDIAEIKMISGGGGPLSPISFTHISSSRNQAVISSIFEEYYWLDSTPVSEEKTQIADGGYFSVQFILNNGEVKKLNFINGDFYYDGVSNYFELMRLPVFRDGTNFVKKYGFEAIENRFQIHLMDETSVCEIPVSAFEFTELTDDICLDDIAPTYYTEMRGTKISFIRDCYFYMNDNRSVYYQLAGKNLDELLAEYRES